MNFLGRLGRAVVDVDRAPISLSGALRAGIFVGAVLTWGVLADEIVIALSATIGVLFVCIADPLRSEATRIRIGAWFILWAALACFAGGAVAGDDAAHLAVAAVVALVGGYVGALGASGTVLGMLSVVLFSVYAGTPVSMGAAIVDALALAVGAALGLVVIAAPGVLGRARNSRAAFARLARGLGHTHVRDPLSVGAAVHAARSREFLDLVAQERLAPETDAWFHRIARDATRARLGMFGMSAVVAGAPDSHAPSIEFLHAAKRCWLAAANTALWGTGRARLQQSVDALGPALAALRDPAAIASAHEVQAGLEGLAQTLVTERPLPVRLPWTRATRSVRPAASPAPVSRRIAQRAAASRAALRNHLHINDPYARHAIRLAVTFVAATLIANQLGFEHSYWLPMSVAWIGKPAMGDTTVRVAARILGTAVGIVASAAILEYLQPTEGWMVALVALAAVLAVAYLAANYAIAVLGITTFVFVLFSLAGSIQGADLQTSLGDRLFATALAGVLVLIAAFVWPTRAGSKVDESLGVYSLALASFAGPVLSQRSTTVDDEKADLLAARTRAAADLRACQFEFGHQHLHPETATGVLEHLHLATSTSIACELGDTSLTDAKAADAVVVELTDLQVRLAASAQQGVIPPRRHPPALDHPVHVAARRAHLILDANAAHRGHTDRFHPHENAPAPPAGTRSG